MPRKTPGPILRETNKSIAAAIADKTLDAKISAGPIAALKKVAEQLDHPDFPVIDGRLDNVSLPTYLRYADQLRLTPATRPRKSEGDNGGGNGNTGGTLSVLREEQQRRSGRSA